MSWHFERGSFDGFESVTVRTERARLVLVTGAGPRIAFFGRPDGEKNALYWNRDGMVRGDWRLLGGHRVWLTRPMADESEDTYAEDSRPCRLEMEIGDGEVCATAPPHPFTQLERGIRVRVLGENCFEVTNFIKNTGPLVYSGGVWSPTCINPRGKVIRVPLGEEGATWDMVHIVIPRVFAGNTATVEDSQVTFEGNEMVVRSQGRLTKRCAGAPRGEVSMEWPEEGLVFTKKAEYVRGGRYPLGGCNVAVFIGENDWMGELETFGAEQTVRPGETICNREIWKLEDRR